MLETSSKLIGKTDYFKEAVDCALRTGWVKPEQKESLIRDYLRPIYKEYIKVLQEVKKELNQESEPYITIDKVIEKLNPILERTRRIGSTEPGNILREIEEYIQFACNETFKIQKKIKDKALYTNFHINSKNYINEFNQVLIKGWLRIIKAISLTDNSEGRILRLYKQKNNLMYCTQLEQRSGLMFMRMKKRVLN